jgi:hypothetical protein
MIEINDEYMALPREDRRKHIDLSEPCIERGGMSTHHRGVLAQYLNSNIPQGRKLCCHACNNAKCSNPKHLYWGTDHDNINVDAVENGTKKSPWEAMVKKYGYEEACKINSRTKIGNNYGSSNKDKPKSETHKKRISDSLKRI